MKILMICDAFFNNLQYQENLLAKSYIKLGHEVIIITSTHENLIDFTNDIHDNSKSEKIEYSDNIKIYRQPYSLNILHKIRRFKDVSKILEKEKPDFLYIHDIQFNTGDLVKYKKKHHVKFIMDFHADYTNSGKNWLSINILHRIIRKKYLHYFLKYIDKIYPVVPGSEDFLYELYDIPRKRMEILPLGCDYQECQNIRNQVNINQNRAKLGIKHDDIVIITGGKFHENKRTHLAVKAIKKLNLPNVHLIVFGTADRGFEEYEKNMHKESKGYNIHFSGWVDAKSTYELMAISDIALFPSSQSVLWQQSIGMHLALIAGDNGGQDMSYLNKNNNLIKIDKQNLNEYFFADILRNLIDHPEILKDMKSGAEKTAKEFLDYIMIAMKTLS